jgi:hypothetical protein
MGVADGVGFHRSEPEALGGVVGRLLQAPVVEDECLGLAVFEEKLAVVGALETTVEVALEAHSVEPGAVDERGRRDLGHGRSREAVPST